MNTAKEKGAAVLSSAVANFGVPPSGCDGACSNVALVLPEFRLHAGTSWGFTFWQILGFTNAGRRLDRQ